MATIHVDTRQQDGKHRMKHGAMEAAGHVLVRTKLHCGDYALPPRRAVDTKKDIAELAADVWQQHERFRRELEAAKTDGTELTVLVENREGVDSLESLAGWRETAAAARRRGKAARPINGLTLAKACATMGAKHGARFMFCKPEEAAAIIERILIGGGGDGDHAGNGADARGAGRGDLPAEAARQGTCDCRVAEVRG